MSHFTRRHLLAQQHLDWRGWLPHGCVVSRLVRSHRSRHWSLLFLICSQRLRRLRREPLR
ncbi:MAG: hypothetical protein RLZZ536_3226 [Planctomycetota bacterium]